MERFGSNNNYGVTLFIGILASAFLVSISVLFLLRTGDVNALFLLALPAGILYGTLFLVPKEICIDTHGIVFRTLFVDRFIEIDSVEAVREFYSGSNLNRADGDKEKAAMLCFLRIKGRPWRIVFFGDHIMKYKELSAQLKMLIADST